MPWNSVLDGACPASTRTTVDGLGPPDHPPRNQNLPGQLLDETHGSAPRVRRWIVPSSTVGHGRTGEMRGHALGGTISGTERRGTAGNALVRGGT